MCAEIRVNFRCLRSWKQSSMAMLLTTFAFVGAIYMPDIMDVWRGILENLPYNRKDF